MPWLSTKHHQLIICKTADFSPNPIFHPMSPYKTVMLQGHRRQKFVTELWHSVRGLPIKSTVKCQPPKLKAKVMYGHSVAKKWRQVFDP